MKNIQGWVIESKNVGQALWPLLYWGRDRVANNTPCMTSSSLSSPGEKAKFCVIGEVKDGAYPSLQPSKHTTLFLYFIIEAICSLKNRAGCPHPLNSAGAPMSSPSANREEPSRTSSRVFAPSPCSLVFLLPVMGCLFDWPPSRSPFGGGGGTLDPEGGSGHQSSVTRGG